MVYTLISVFHCYVKSLAIGNPGLVWQLHKIIRDSISFLISFIHISAAVTPKFQAVRKREWKESVKSGMVPALNLSF